MTTLFVRKVDESTLRYDSDDEGVLYELSDYFSFLTPNYKYDRRFQNHLWDGMIHLCPVRRKTTMLGLYHRIEQFCKERGYSFEDQTPDHVRVSPDDSKDLEGFIESLKLPFKVRDYQLKAVRFAIDNSRGILLSPTGCHASGSMIRMADGSVKAVDDLRIGDLLMGIDGISRTVIKLFHGRDTMYRIESIQNRFKPFIVNSEHELPLFDCNRGKIINVPVDEYVKKSKNFKHTHYLLLNDSELKFSGCTNELKIDPYFMGLYLGDGHTHNTAITTADSEVADYVTNYVNDHYKDLHIRIGNNGSKANTYNFSANVPWRKNQLKEDFLFYGLNFSNSKSRTSCSEKFIPEEYKHGSVEQRYELLAGLIDSDGCLSSTRTYYDICMKSSKLINDIADVARSLGFVCTIRERMVNAAVYYRMSIVGNVERIPCRLGRKTTKGTDSRNVNPHHVRFNVTKLGEDEYFGVCTDGDHLYYNDDYVLNHNSGKSLILYILLRWHYSRGRKICLIVPSTSLVEQMISDFAEYSESDPSFNAREIIKPIYAKTDTDPFESRVVVSTWQSLMHYDKELMESWDVVMNDEVHGAQSKVVSDIIGKAKNAPFKIGTTGSLSGKDMHEFILTGLFGKIYQVTTTKDLQDDGTLSKMRIYMITLKHGRDSIKSYYNKVYNESGKRPSYADEVEFLCDDPRREKFVRNLACACKGVTMVLFNRKKQGFDLERLIKEKVGDSRAVFHIDGDVDPETRERIRNEVFSNNDAILVASVGTSATGLNIPSIANIILCPSKSRIRNLQSIGRSLRLSSGKEIATVFDIVDDFSAYRRIKSYSVKHGLERYELYQEQGFDIAFKTIDF